MHRLTCGCKFADPDTVVPSAAAASHRVRPDTMSCGSDGCRDGGSEIGRASCRERVSFVV